MVDDKGAELPPPEPGLEDDPGGRRILQRLARRLQNPRQLSGDAMELVGALLETSDRAKTEMVRMVAREVRNYLEELQIKEDLHDLLTGHSLEVQMSLSLKPLAGAEPRRRRRDDAEGRKRRADADEGEGEGG